MRILSTLERFELSCMFNVKVLGKLGVCVYVVVVVKYFMSPGIVCVNRSLVYRKWLAHSWVRSRILSRGWSACWWCSWLPSWPASPATWRRPPSLYPSWQSWWVVRIIITLILLMVFQKMSKISSTIAYDRMV